MRLRLAPLAVSGALLALCLAPLACGGGGGGDASSDSVIEGWVKALSKGDPEGAAGYFALPSRVENGAAPITLRSHADAIAFNRSLPCGARLVSTRKLGSFVDATFRLTDRPGGSCGSGVGELARTAFLIRNGEIVQWRRLPNPPGGGGGAGGGPIV